MRRWLLWAVWFLSLFGAPAGLLVVNAVYPDVPSYPPPWPAEPSMPERLASGLLILHLVLLVPAAALTWALIRKWAVVLAVWAAIAAGAWVMMLLTLGVVMAKSGKYL